MRHSTFPIGSECHVIMTLPPHTSFYGYDSIFTQPRALPAPSSHPPLAFANVLAPPAGLPFSVSRQAGPGDSLPRGQWEWRRWDLPTQICDHHAKSSKRATRADGAPSVQAQPLLPLTWLVGMTVTLMSPCILRRQGNTLREVKSQRKSHSQ